MAMRRSKVFLLFLSVMFIFTILPINASTDIESTENETVIIQPKFTNITVFYNDFYITNQGKAVLTSSIDARNVDECKISMYLQKYQNGSWTTVKHWSTIESGTFCGLGETWYVMSGYQYRMVSYGYVYKADNFLESTSYTSKKVIF
jgi:hypothetical protein